MKKSELRQIIKEEFLKENYTQVKSNIGNVWKTDKDLMHDIKWYLLESHDAAGEAGFNQTVKAFKRAIDSATKRMKGRYS